MIPFDSTDPRHRAALCSLLRAGCAGSSVARMGLHAWSPRYAVVDALQAIDPNGSHTDRLEEIDECDCYDDARAWDTLWSMTTGDGDAMEWDRCLMWELLPRVAFNSGAHRGRPSWVLALGTTPRLAPMAFAGRCAVDDTFGCAPIDHG